VDRLEELEEKEALGEFEKLPKKEVAVLRRELKNLQKNLGGMKGMTKIPDVVIAVDQRCEHIALQECKTLNIPTICVVDTNNDPDDVTIPIPANDDSIASIVLLMNKLGSSILEGRQKSKS
jgi:small subunit ribosomal protein S2